MPRRRSKGTSGYRPYSRLSTPTYWEEPEYADPGGPVIRTEHRMPEPPLPAGSIYCWQFDAQGRCREMWLCPEDPDDIRDYERWAL